MCAVRVKCSPSLLCILISCIYFCFLFYTSQYFPQLLMSHPILSVWFHHPAELYDSYQRLSVAFGSIFTILTVNALFFGQGKQSVEQDLSISIYSAIITAPIGVFFPMLFTRAAAKAASQVRGRMEAIRAANNSEHADHDLFFALAKQTFSTRVSAIIFPLSKPM